MRGLALPVALLSMPAFAADHTPWPGHELEPGATAWVEMAQQRDTCCKHCTKGKPCGNSCIAARYRSGASSAPIGSGSSKSWQTALALRRILLVDHHIPVCAAGWMSAPAIVGS
jgi:hypothetical protein